MVRQRSRHPANPGCAERPSTLSAIQEVYRLRVAQQSTTSIEVIVRQMLRKAEINETGDSDFIG